MITAAAARAAQEQFRDEGYAVVRGFLDAGEIAAVQAETRRIYAEAIQHPHTWRHRNLYYEILPESAFGARYMVQAHWIAWVSETFEQLRRSEGYRLLLEGLLGPDIRQIAQQIHWKPPGARLSGYRYHQDLRFRDAAEAGQVAQSTVTTGLAIDRATRANGCLCVVPGSHRRGYLGLSDDGPIMKGVTAEEELRAVGIDPAEIVALEMEPGDLAVWGLLTVHGSAQNTSDADRAFLIQSYVRADATARGEWAFRGGVSQPLGETPQLCKYDGLFERPGPFYDTTEWWR
jgi:ectoine hydroxylase-related dioxygenase (phytanoyl-CoA dioxygenase family)